MTLKGSTAALVAAACVAALFAVGRGSLQARQAPAAPPFSPSTGLDGLLAASLVFTASDVNKDGAVPHDELKATMEKWLQDADAAKSGSITRDQLIPVLNTAMPIAGLAAALAGGGRGAGQPQTP